MNTGFIVRTDFKDEMASHGLSAWCIHKAWTEVVAFKNDYAWGCFQISEKNWFMRGLFNAPSISVTAGPRGKGILNYLLYGGIANVAFRLHSDGVPVCSAEVGFGSGGFYVNNRECISYSAQGKFLGKVTYSSSVCDVVQPGLRDKSWRIIVKNDGQDVLAACIAYYFYICHEDERMSGRPYGI